MYFAGVTTTPLAVLVSTLLPHLAGAVCVPRDPFKILDPQNWRNADSMSWAEYVPLPGTDWANPARAGSVRNFKIALVSVDYSDMPFVVTQAPHSTIFTNPQPEAANLARADIPDYYYDLLMTPNELNRGHTLHEYWMEDSGGRFGVDLTSFGPYRMPSRYYQYGISNDMNPGECPGNERCNMNLRTDALAAWRAEVGDVASSFELVFILSAGQDESSTWQTWGEIRFQTREDVPAEFGPPSNPFGNDTNWATTRYGLWSSWAAASTIWPNAGGGSSLQGESSGTAVYAHELSHLLGIGDNYNNPYDSPMRRAYTGPWSMMSHGSFGGPGGPHSRWMIPSVYGGSLGSHHTVRDKIKLGLMANESLLRVSKQELASSGVAVVDLTARCIDPSPGTLLGFRVILGTDLSSCNISAQVDCDGGGYNNYEIEVIDRMGSESFQPDAGVMISKTKDQDRSPFQWTIDANPQDIEIINFYRPKGDKAYITLGDYRQLSDALFHAGTRSGSEYEYVDAVNGLHFYVLDKHRDSTGVLSYTVGVLSLASTGGNSAYGVTLADGIVLSGGVASPTVNGVTCSFDLINTGSAGNVPLHYSSDIFRLTVEVEGSGWRVELPNALITAKFGASRSAYVAVGAAVDAADDAVVTLTATSETDPSVFSTAECLVHKF